MEGCWSHLLDFCGNGFSRVKNTVCEQTPICPQNMARLWAGTTKSVLEKLKEGAETSARNCQGLSQTWNFSNQDQADAFLEDAPSLDANC